jgi:putative oxidoreductase
MTDTTQDTKPILPFTKPLTEILSPFAEPVLRITTGALLIPHGYGKLFNEGALQGTADFFASVGFSPAYPLALAVALLEFVGGIMLVAGLLTRVVAVAVAVFMAQAALFHAGNGFLWNNGGYEYPLMWMVAALFFAVKGGGRFSVDRKIGREF